MKDSLRYIYEQDKEKYNSFERDNIKEILEMLEKNELSNKVKEDYYKKLEKNLIGLRKCFGDDSSSDYDKLSTRMTLDSNIETLLSSLRECIVEGNNPEEAVIDLRDNPDEEEDAGKKKTHAGKIIISSVAIIALLAGGYVLVKNLPKITKNNNGNGKGLSKSLGDTIDNIKDSTGYDYNNNVVIIDDGNKTSDLDNNTNNALTNTDANAANDNTNNALTNTDANAANDNTDKADDSGLVLVEETVEALTTENFENLVSEYVNMYSEEYDGIVSTKDIVKFAAITNIDVLCEDNRELANELFGKQTKEEYLGDAAKLIGATVMYNFKQWNSSMSTENFIRVSNLVYGEQREKMLKIEDYTDKIALAVIAEDGDLVNEIIDKFLTDMNSGSLSKLDDGVGFAAQVNIAVIADGIAKDYLNQENYDMFSVLETSEKYVSNIFTEYEQCTVDEVKTKIK